MHTITFNVNRKEWGTLSLIETRCEHAKAAGVITDYSVHHDHINNVAIYTIAYNERAAA